MLVLFSLPRCILPSLLHLSKYLAFFEAQSGLSSLGAFPNSPGRVELCILWVARAVGNHSNDSLVLYLPRQLECEPPESRDGTQFCSRSSMNTDLILKYSVQFPLSCDISVMVSTSSNVKWRPFLSLCLVGRRMWSSNKLLIFSYSESFKMIPKDHDNNHELAWLQQKRAGPQTVLWAPLCFTLLEMKSFQLHSPE